MNSVVTIMTASERRISTALASLFALRMLGLFLLMPVFVLAAKHLPGADSSFKLGLALGAYGLTQACMQIPFGLASDKYGRRLVVACGLLLFIAGSVICALADSIFWIIIGRAVQGSGAISAAVTAWLADATREEVRAKAMAVIGASIGLTFAVSLVLSPVLVGLGGLSGLFWVIALLGVLALVLTLWFIPSAPRQDIQGLKAPASAVWQHRGLLRMNLGVFSLHFFQVAMFVVIPSALVKMGHLDTQDMWQVYLPVVILALVIMIPIVGFTEAKRMHILSMRLAVMGLTVVAVTLPWASQSFNGLVISLVAFFTLFNVLEALQPSLVSRIAPPNLKGLALGFYNTSQALGLFAGGALGGWLVANYSSTLLFAVLSVLCVCWWLSLRRLKMPLLS